MLKLTISNRFILLGYLLIALAIPLTLNADTNSKSELSLQECEQLKKELQIKEVQTMPSHKDLEEETKQMIEANKPLIEAGKKDPINFLAKIQKLREERRKKFEQYMNCTMKKGEEIFRLPAKWNKALKITSINKISQTKYNATHANGDRSKCTFVIFPVNQSYFSCENESHNDSPMYYCMTPNEGESDGAYDFGLGTMVCMVDTALIMDTMMSSSHTR